jgi:hypothetical protein
LLAPRITSQDERKGQQQWDIDEVFALKKTGTLDTAVKVKAIRESIADKLFVHTIEFGEQCQEVTILGNVYSKDEVHDPVASIFINTGGRTANR